MPVPQDFVKAFQNYLPDAQAARIKDQPERQRSALLLGFIQEAFEVETRDFLLEQVIPIVNVQRKGYMDALFGDLIFEFKRHLPSDDHHRNQLLDYLLSQTDGREHIGILTDGILFEVYVLQKQELRQTDTFDLEKIDAESAFIRLDKYLFSQKNVAPTSEDVVQRFGNSSPTFNRAFQELTTLHDQVKNQVAIKVWRDQWSKLLSKVYGSDIADDNLYLRHTYLCQFAKLLAYAALRGIPPDDATIRSIINGEAFYGEGVSNIGEHDFFAWVLLDDIEAQAVRLFRRLAEGLIVYDLARIDQDLLKQLYQNLVDPATRHDLGEFYTPDWLAELTLEDINYHHPQSLLDPACGSGSFLFTAIKRLADLGLSGWSLVSFAVDNIMGMDVHPLAITIARINYLLALSDHMKTPRPARQTDLIAVPIYMADALVTPKLESKFKETLVVPVDERRNENFFIPVSAAHSPEALTEVIEQMDKFAQLTKDPLKAETYKPAFEKLIRERFIDSSTAAPSDTPLAYWVRNLSLLSKLIREDRNSIWAYILKNQSRPLVLAERKFDVIVGNPPWLSYRFIKSRTYQKEVKALYQHYNLIESNDTSLFTQMDLSTLFFAHARSQYLKPSGILAFVMPRSVITGAKQHRPFQAQGMTRVLDLLAVHPLFHVPTCVIILDNQERLVTTQVLSEIGKRSVPSTIYSAYLRAHEMSLAEARPALTSAPGIVRFVDSEVRSPYYYERFVQGASLVPRNLCFVKPESNPNSPAVISDPEANREAKEPWKDIKLKGVVEDEYIYATLLSKHLVPFGYEKLHMVAIPARLQSDGKIRMLDREDDFAEQAHFKSWNWFATAEKKWDSLKKDTSEYSLSGWLNYQNKLSRQIANGKIKVLYTASGVHLAACMIDTQNQSYVVYGRHTQGLVIDSKCYFCDVESIYEADFLCSLLNSPIVDNAIKSYQSRGKGNVGERDIHRAPFEACAIPPFDPTNPDHLELARLSQEAHEVIATLKQLGGLTGGVVTIRRAARAAVASQLTAIDVIARRVLGL